MLGRLKCPEAAVGAGLGSRALPGAGPARDLRSSGNVATGCSSSLHGQLHAAPETAGLSPDSPTKNASFHHLCLSLLKLGIKFQFPVRKNVRLALRVSSVAAPERPGPAMPRPHTHALCRRPLPGTRGQAQPSESRPSFFQKRASHLRPEEIAKAKD